MEFHLASHNLKFDYSTITTEPEVFFGIYGNNLGLTDDNVTEIISPDTLINDMSKSLVCLHLGLFGFFNKSPSIIEAIKKEGLACAKDENTYYVIIPRAYLLGLSTTNPEHVIEVAKTLDFIKQEAFNNPKEDMKICIHRGFGERDISILCGSQAKETEMNSWFNEKINSSSVLSDWRKNLLEGIDNTSPQCDNLYNTMSVMSLMTWEEKNTYMDSIKPVKSQSHLSRYKHKK